MHKRNRSLTWKTCSSTLNSFFRVEASFADASPNCCTIFFRDLSSCTNKRDLSFTISMKSFHLKKTTDTHNKEINIFKSQAKITMSCRPYTCNYITYISHELFWNQDMSAGIIATGSTKQILRQFPTCRFILHGVL